MEVKVQTHKIELPGKSRTELAERIRDSFSRLSSRVARLHVTLKDINGPRGGRDKVCVLRAELRDGGEVMVVDRSSRLRSALMRSMRRARGLIDREVQRRQALARKRLPKTRFAMADTA
jgi:hypothetical protein